MTETVIEAQQDTEPTSEEPSKASQTVGSSLMSVAFWFTLLATAAVYAAVALSPKLAAWITVRQQFTSNAARLAELEDGADYLERVASALKSDAEFAERLVNATQGRRPQSSGIVSVTSDLQFADVPAMIHREPQVVHPRLAKLVFHLASHEPHRTWLLFGCCVLTLLAFSVLNEAGAGVVLAALGMVRTAISTSVGRYRISSENKPDVDEAI